MDIVTIIREFMHDELAESGFHEGVTNNDSLVDLEILDSLGFMIFLGFIDEKFGIIPSDDELDPMNFETIDIIAEYISKKIPQPTLEKSD